MPKRAVENCRRVTMSMLKPHLALLNSEHYIGSGESRKAGSLGFDVLCQGTAFVVPFANGERCNLKATTPYFGNLRWWFSCPVCGRRCGVLYLPPGAARIACRVCHELTYKSQQWSRSVFAPLFRVNRLTQCLGGTGSRPTPSDPLLPRPKHMHQKTYERKLGQILAAQERAIPIMDAWLAKREQEKAKVEKQWRQAEILLNHP